MLIKCPKCQTVYELDDNVVTSNGLKMRCNTCGEVFKAYPEDAVPDEKDKEEKKQSILKMFERVSATTDSLFEATDGGASSATPSKVRVIHLTHYKNSINYLLLLLLILIMGGLLYAARYDIVRYAPNAEKIYDKFGIESIYRGTNLQFTNIKTEEIIVNNVSKIKISGVINNSTLYEMFVLPVKIVVFNEQGDKILDTTHYLPQERTRPNYRFPFEVLITNPTPEKKNIQITFADDL